MPFKGNLPKSGELAVEMIQELNAKPFTDSLIMVESEHFKTITEANLHVPEIAEALLPLFYLIGIEEYGRLMLPYPPQWNTSHLVGS